MSRRCYSFTCFLVAYAKNEQVALSAAEKKMLRNMVKQLEELG